MRERGEKGATLVEAVDGELTISHRTLDHARWSRVNVDVAAAPRTTDVLERAQAALLDDRGRRREAAACRIEVGGITTVHGSLVRDRERLDSASCAGWPICSPSRSGSSGSNGRPARLQTVSDDAVGETLKVLRAAAAPTLAAPRRWPTGCGRWR